MAHWFRGKPCAAAAGLVPIFPKIAPIDLAPNPGPVRELSSLIADEVRARGVHLVLSPVVDAARSIANKAGRPI